MKKREGFLEGIILPVMLTLKMFIPPFCSLERLEKSCKTWIKKNPQAYFPRSSLADLYRFYQKNEEAKKEYQEIQCLGLTKDSDLLGLSEILYRLKDYQGVIETLAPIIDKYPKHKNANWYLGVSYMEKEDYQNAIVYLERLITIGRGRYMDYWHLGYCYSHTDNIEKAEEAYKKALSMKPDSKELKKNLTSIYIRKGQSLLNSNLKESEMYFKKALALDPDNPDAIEMLNEIKRMRN